MRNYHTGQAMRRKVMAGALAVAALFTSKVLLAGGIASDSSALSRFKTEEQAALITVGARSPIVPATSVEAAKD